MIALLLTSLSAVSFIFLFVRYKSKPSVAVGCAVLASFLFPSFWIIEVYGQPISVQTAGAVVSLVLFLITGGVLRWRITAGDLAIGFVCLIHCISDGVVHRDGWGAIVVAYGEWMLPYAAGRFAFGSIQSFSAARWILVVFFSLSLVVWQLDIWFRFNPVHWLSETYGNWDATRQAFRFSVTRSSGMTEHPIFFSGLLMSLLPLLVLAFRRTRDEDLTNRYLLYTFGLSAICLTLSRAAVVSLVLTGLFMLTIRYRRTRWPIVLSGLGLVVLTFARPGWVENAWMKTGGSSDQRKRSISIDGEERLHSSTLARLRVFDVYGRSAMRAGLFGYGTGAVREFPPNLPFLPKEAAATETVWTVENSYLLALLRFGWLGLLAFCALVLVPLGQLLAVTDRVRQRQLAVVVMGLTSIGILLATVHSSYEIMFPYLWVMGLFNALVDPRIGSKAAIVTDSTSAG